MTATTMTVPAPPAFVESAIFRVLPEHDTLAKIQCGIARVDLALRKRLADNYPPLPPGYAWHRSDELIAGFENACRIRYRIRYIGVP